MHERMFGVKDLIERVFRTGPATSASVSKHTFELPVLPIWEPL
jgi:hypothetical protein